MKKIIKAVYELPEIDEVEGTETIKTHFVHILFEDKLASASELLDSYFAPLCDVIGYDMKVVYPFKSGYHFDVDLCDQALIENARTRKVLNQRRTETVTL